MTVSLAPIKKFMSSRTVRLVALLILAIALLALVYVLFLGEREESGYAPSEKEARVLALVREIGGVSDAKVVVSEEDGRAVGAVILFEGEDGFLTRVRIREVAAAVLKISPSAVLVYVGEQ